MSFHYHRYYVKLTAILWDLLWDCSVLEQRLGQKFRKRIAWQLLHSDLCAVLGCETGSMGLVPESAYECNSTHGRAQYDAISLFVFGTGCIVQYAYLTKLNWNNHFLVFFSRQWSVFREGLRFSVFDLCH